MRLLKFHSPQINWLCADEKKTPIKDIYFYLDRQLQFLFRVFFSDNNLKQIIGQLFFFFLISQNV